MLTIEGTLGEIWLTAFHQKFISSRVSKSVSRESHFSPQNNRSLSVISRWFKVLGKHRKEKKIRSLRIKRKRASEKNVWITLEIRNGSVSFLSFGFFFCSKVQGTNDICIITLKVEDSRPSVQQLFFRKMHHGNNGRKKCTWVATD